MKPQNKKNINKNLRKSAESNLLTNKYKSKASNSKKYPTQKTRLNSATKRQKTNIYNNNNNNIEDNFCRTFSNFRNFTAYKLEDQEDMRLLFCLRMLNLDNLTNLFKKNNIDFDTLLFIPFKNLSRLGLTGNAIKKIHDFSVDYIKNGSLYTLEELKSYFNDKKKVSKRYSSYDKKINNKNNPINNNHYCNIYNYINSTNNNFTVRSDNNNKLTPYISSSTKKNISKNYYKEYYNNTNKSISSINNSNLNSNGYYLQESHLSNKSDNTNYEILCHMNTTPSNNNNLFANNYNTIHKNNFINNNFNTNKIHSSTDENYGRRKNKQLDEFEMKVINKSLKKNNNKNNSIYKNMSEYSNKMRNLMDSIYNFKGDIKNISAIKNENNYYCYDFSKKYNNTSYLNYKNNNNNMFQQIHNLKTKNRNTALDYNSYINNSNANKQILRNNTNNNTKSIHTKNSLNFNSTQNSNECIHAYNENHFNKNIINYSLNNISNLKQKPLLSHQRNFDGRNSYLTQMITKTHSKINDHMNNKYKNVQTEPKITYNNMYYKKNILYNNFT